MQDLALAMVTNSALEACGIDHGLPCPTKAQAVNVSAKISVPYMLAGSTPGQKSYGCTQCADRPSLQATGWPPWYVSETPSSRLKPFFYTKFVDQNQNLPEPSEVYHTQDRRLSLSKPYRPAWGRMDKNELARTPSTRSGVEETEKT